MVLQSLFSKDFLTQVVNIALAQRPKAPALRLQLESACRKTLREAGIRDPATAPNRLLVAPILDSLRYSDTIFNGILQLWLDARQPVYEAALSYLADRALVTIETDELRYGFPGIWPESVMRAAARELCAAHPELDPDDAALMLCLLTGQAPLPSEDIEIAPPQPPEAPRPEPPPPPRDLEAALRDIETALDQSRQLWADGDLSAWPRWIARFTDQTAQATIAWETTRRIVRANCDELINHATLALASGDLTELRIRVDAIPRRCEKPADLAPAQQALAQLAEEVVTYPVRRQIALAAFDEARTGHTAALAQARHWHLSIVDEAPVPAIDSATAPVRDLELSAKLIRETQRAVEQELQQARAQLVSDLLGGCDELLSQPGAEVVSKGVRALQDRLHTDLSDEDLHAAQAELETLREQERTAQSARLPDVVQAAEAYRQEPDQTYLDLLLDALAQNSRAAEDYALLTIALQSDWRPGTGMSAVVFNAFWRGLLQVTPPEQALAAAIDMLAESFFINQVRLDDAGAQLGLSIFYVSALAARPRCLIVGDLWRLRNDDAYPAAPIWIRLINQVRQGSLPKIRRRRDLPAHELQRVAAKIEDDLKREGGRFVRSRGKGSLTMLNMEQQHLLPALEERWKAFKNSQPGQKRWHELKDWLAANDEAQIFEYYCEQAGVTTDDSPFFRPAIEGRIRHQLDNFHEYAGLREELAGIQAEQTVLLDDALSELEQLAPALGEPMTMLIQAALAEIGETIPAQPDFAATLLSRERRCAQRLRHAVFARRAYSATLPQMGAWLGSNALRGGVNWSALLRATLNSLAQPLRAEELFEFYVSQPLPDLAQDFLSTQSATAAEHLADLQRLLKNNLLTRQTALKKYKVTLTPDEDEWLSEGRWPLLSRSLEGRLEQLRQAELRREQESRTLLLNLRRRARALEDRVDETDILPPATVLELQQALEMVRRALPEQAALAEDVLSEITHMLDFRSSNAEGVHRAYEALRQALDKPEISPVEAPGELIDIIQALRRGDYQAQGLTAGQYTESQWEDRLDLLTLWHKVKTYPAEADRLTKPQIEDLRQLCRLFARVVWMWHGELRPGQKVTHYFLANPVVHFESSFIRPRVSVLRTNVALVLLTEEQIVPRRLKELDRVIDDQHWLLDGFFVVVLVMGEAAPVHDWARRRYTDKRLAVIDIERLKQIAIASDPRPGTGRFRHMLLQVAGPQTAEIFRYQNLVDSDHEIFVGRTDWIEQLTQGEQNYAVYGGRRIGKTSLLHAVLKKLDSLGFRAIYKSLEASARERGALPAAQDVLRILGLTATCNTFTDFGQILSAYLAQNPEARVTILLDELDPYIKARRELKEPHVLIETCREIYQQHPYQLKFIMAGFVELWRQLRPESSDLEGRSSPYHNFLKDLGRLPGLPTADAQKIVFEGFQNDLGIRLESPSIPRTIIEATAGHPAFVQYFCEQLQRKVKQRNGDEVLKSDVESVFADNSSQAYIHFVFGTLELNLNALARILIYLLVAENMSRFSAEDIIHLAQSYGLAIVSLEEVIESCQELQISSVFEREDSRYFFSVPSYPAILRRLEMADQAKLNNLITTYQSKKRQS